MRKFEINTGGTSVLSKNDVWFWAERRSCFFQNESGYCEWSSIKDNEERLSVERIRSYENPEHMVPVRYHLPYIGSNTESCKGDLTVE